MEKKEKRREGEAHIREGEGKGEKGDGDVGMRRKGKRGIRDRVEMVMEVKVV